MILKDLMHTGEKTTMLTAHRRFQLPVAIGIRWFCFFACLWLSGLAATAQDKFANADCLNCHLDPSTTRVIDGKTESLVFPTNSFANSVHAKLACVDCHTGIKDLVHDPLGPPSCVVCHTNEA